jgi:hypothetical protein
MVPRCDSTGRSWRGNLPRNLSDLRRESGGGILQMKIKLFGLLVQIIVLVWSMVLNVAILHWGWGLNPANWYVIIFGVIGNIFLLFLSVSAGELTKDEKK